MPSPVVVLSDALRSHGYGPRPSGHGALYPADAARLAELAASLRKRSFWSLAAACDSLSAGFALAKEAMSLPPGEARMPGLVAADACYQRVVSLCVGGT